ncbi:hypothetical protein RHSIM_Rhsim04G0214800 [Rhododendron simsii]|uniref:Peroxidase n=1 Tax=Rhododendron simsii TaxID=118357 RepID=A0A834LQ89_RHOSS|nr:hypothetical protein RHSIM_Rhsim04G0214800 [Rhododendron simsii]
MKNFQLKVVVVCTMEYFVGYWASVIVVVLGIVGDCHGDGLRKNFYKDSCPLAEQIVRNITWTNVASNPFLPAKLLRMQFHDCFVRGCEASVLLNSTADNTAEKDAFPNLSLEGFDVIDEIKTQLAKINCSNIVSCADIIALATRDAVSFQYNRSMWTVKTGRRDGTVSLASEVNLPSPFDDFAGLKQAFADKGLSLKDLVVLSGAHTIGIGNCEFFSNRLYNFNGTNGSADPSLNSTYASFLKTKCSATDTTTVVPLDPGSGRTFDNHYYTILKLNEGLFQSDAALLTNDHAREIVDEMATTTNEEFFKYFRHSITRMIAIGVLTGDSGEIRQKCSVINP